MKSSILNLSHEAEIDPEDLAGLLSSYADLADRVEQKLEPGNDQAIIWTLLSVHIEPNRYLFGHVNLAQRALVASSFDVRGANGAEVWVGPQPCGGIRIFSGLRYGGPSSSHNLEDFAEHIVSGLRTGRTEV